MVHACRGRATNHTRITQRKGGWPGERAQRFNNPTIVSNLPGRAELIRDGGAQAMPPNAEIFNKKALWQTPNHANVRLNATIGGFHRP